MAQIFGLKLLEGSTWHTPAVPVNPGQLRRRMSTCDTVNQQLSAEARLSPEERLTAQRKGVGKVRESDGVGTFGLATRERSGGWVFFFHTRAEAECLGADVGDQRLLSCLGSPRADVKESHRPPAALRRLSMM